MEDLTTPSDFKPSNSEADYSSSVLVNTVPITLDWRDIRQQVDIKKFFGLRYDHTKPILHGVSGSAKSGRFLAIMGGSGI
jgi:ABC-type multidrug transport system ATPase subunit